MVDIAIIGGGPAGLTAAIYARRAEKKTLIIEALSCGGQMNNTAKIDNYPAFSEISGPELGQQMCTQAEGLGAEIEYDKVVRIESLDDGFKIIGEDGEYSARAVIIATGTTPRKIGIAREDELLGRGISYCATCDGAFYRDKTVAVYGGGFSAVHEALYLSDIASKVYLVHHHSKLKASGELVDQAAHRTNIEFVFDNDISELIGKDKLTAIKLSDGQEVAVDGLFVAIGREPKCDFCPDLELSDGFISADESCKTNIPGIFVAGDVRTKAVRQIVTATSDGAAASEAAIQYLAKS